MMCSLSEERFSLNVQTKSSLSEPLKLTPKWQQWQLDITLLNNDLYKYLVMLFELFNASVLFQNHINNILQDYLDVFCIIYINNILIYSDTLKEHRQHVWQILQKLQRAEL